MRRTGNRAVSWLVVAAVTAMLSPVSMSFAAVANNEVTSVKIKEADGTSGQSTNTGSGVKTGHIQDGAVTASKIVDGSVTDAKIAGPISGSKLGAHGHNVSDLVGTIDASNLPVGTTTGTVAAGDHNHDSIYQKKYANVIVVAKSGGDFTDPFVAMNNVASWCGIPSAVNPCMVKIMPGTYDIGSNTIVTRAFTDIEGSGPNVTKIIGNKTDLQQGSANWYGALLYIQSPNVEIRNLSVENNGTGFGSAAAIAIDQYSFEGGRLNNVNAIAIGVDAATAIVATAPVYYISNVYAKAVANGATGIFAAGGKSFITNSTINATGAAVSYGISGMGNLNVNNTAIAASSGSIYSCGIYDNGATSITIKNSDISSIGTGNYIIGVNSSYSNTTIENSSISGISSSINTYANKLVKVANTKLTGVTGGQNYQCVGVYDASFAPLSAQCK